MFFVRMCPPRKAGGSPFDPCEKQQDAFVTLCCRSRVNIVFEGGALVCPLCSWQKCGWCCFLPLSSRGFLHWVVVPLHPLYQVRSFLEKKKPKKEAKIPAPPKKREEKAAPHPIEGRKNQHNPIGESSSEERWDSSITQSSTAQKGEREESSTTPKLRISELKVLSQFCGKGLKAYVFSKRKLL